MKLKHFWQHGILVAVFAFASGAQAILLEDLFLPGGEIQVGDKLFSNWELIDNNGGTTLKPR